MSPASESDAPRPPEPGPALQGLALASTSLHPDDIPLVVREHGALLGALDVRIHLADLEQRVLIPFTGEPGGGEPITIDATVAGHAYRREEAVVVEGSGAVPTTVWFPLLDSAERLGAVAIDLPAGSPYDIQALRSFVDLVAETISNKSDYGDAITRTRRTRPLTVAAEFRWSMLPPLTFTGRNVTISGVLEPAYSIAGDTFDYAVNDDVLHMAIFDAVGHGLEAARIANLAVAAYRHSRRTDSDLTTAYRSIDGLISEQFGAEKFVTAQLTRLSLHDGVLCWVNAGHPSPMLVRNGRAQDLHCDTCLPLGMAGAGQLDPVLTDVQLEPRDVVLFFTDGVIESRSDGGEQFGRSRLGSLLERAMAAGETTAETLRLLAHAVIAHGELQDDASMVLIAWQGPPRVDP